MTTTKKEAIIPTRVNSFEIRNSDLEDFKPKKAPTTKPTIEHINEVAEKTGFHSRQPEKFQEPVKAIRSRRYTTGRNQQLNLKVTETTLRKFYAIADELNVPLGEVFERAVAALEAIR